MPALALVALAVLAFLAGVVLLDVGRPAPTAAQAVTIPSTTRPPTSTTQKRSTTTASTAPGSPTTATTQTKRKTTTSKAGSTTTAPAGPTTTVLTGITTIPGDANASGPPAGEHIPAARFNPTGLLLTLAGFAAVAGILALQWNLTRPGRAGRTL